MARAVGGEDRFEREATETNAIIRKRISKLQLYSIRSWEEGKRDVIIQHLTIATMDCWDGCRGRRVWMAR